MKWSLVILALSCSVLFAKGQDCTTEFSDLFSPIFNGSEVMVNLDRTVPVNVSVDGLIWINATLTNLTLHFFDGVEPSYCNYDATTNMSAMTLSLPQLAIYAQMYTLGGNLIDSIPLSGYGEALFLLENFDMTLSGHTNTWILADNETETVINFKDYELDLILDRWFISMENLMAGTDYGALIEDFLEMNGPDIFTVLGNALSNRPLVLNLLNCVFPGTGEGLVECLLPGGGIDLRQEISSILKEVILGFKH